MAEDVRMVAALYVERDGCYWDLPGVDPWDEQRDARDRSAASPPKERQL